MLDQKAPLSLAVPVTRAPWDLPQSSPGGRREGDCGLGWTNNGLKILVSFAQL